MGTRADFYLQDGDTLTQEDWMGSIAWDGYPDEIPPAILNATNTTDYLVALIDFRPAREDWTEPSMGWPWPWEDSRTTDYAYVFTSSGLVIYEFGKLVDQSSKDVKEWRGVGDKLDIFPNMTSIQNVTFGDRSGLIVISAPRE